MANNVGVAARILAERFGVTFAARQEVIPVGVTPVVALVNDPDRIQFLVVNTGLTQITLSIRPSVVAGEGVLLLDNGSTLGSNLNDDGIVVAWQWIAVSDLAGGEITVIETVGESLP